MHAPFLGAVYVPVYVPVAPLVLCNVKPPKLPQLFGLSVPASPAAVASLEIVAVMGSAWPSSGEAEPEDGEVMFTEIAAGLTVMLSDACCVVS